jgi:hypothetical protein
MTTKRHLTRLGAGALAGLGAIGCGGPPSVPQHPTWADVAPIMHGECASCHGSTAAATGGGYRLDFFDMTPAVCGAAAQALNGGALFAGSSADKIKEDVTPPPTGDRPRMPPAPGPVLESWQREMLQRWTSEPSKGPPPAGNRAPVIQVGGLPATADATLAFTAVVTDPDGEPAIGVLEIANVLFAMNRSGSFSVALNTSAWSAGTQRLRATLCDGWQNASYDLGPIEIRHK